MAKKKTSKNTEPAQKPVLPEIDNEVKPIHVEKTTDFEREPGDEFDYKDVRLHVLDVIKCSCRGCYFWANNCVNRDKNVTGQCIGRGDRKSVIFKLMKK